MKKIIVNGIANAASLAVMIYGQRVMQPVDYVIQTESLN